MLTFNHSSRWIECPNTCKSIGNGFLMKKYVEAVVRKSFQLVIAAEIEHFENKSPMPKKTQLPGRLKKNKTIFTYMSYSLICPGLGFQNTRKSSLICPGRGGEAARENSFICPGFSSGEAVRRKNVTKFVMQYRARSARGL